MKLRKKFDRVAGGFFLLNAIFAGGVLLGILLFLLSLGVRAFIPGPDFDPGDLESHPVTITSFLFGNTWNPNAYGQPQYGIIALLLGSLLTTIIALLISVPLGIAGALFIYEKIDPPLNTLSADIIASIGLPFNLELGGVVPVLDKKRGENHNRPLSNRQKLKHR